MFLSSPLFETPIIIGFTLTISLKVLLVGVFETESLTFPNNVLIGGRDKTISPGNRNGYDLELITFRVYLGNNHPIYPLFH